MRTRFTTGGVKLQHYDNGAPVIITETNLYNGVSETRGHLTFMFLTWKNHIGKRFILNNILYDIYLFCPNQNHVPGQNITRNSPTII